MGNPAFVPNTLDHRFFNDDAGLVYTLAGLSYSLSGMRTEVDRFINRNRFLIELIERTELQYEPKSWCVHQASISLLRTMHGQLMQISGMVAAVSHHPSLPNVENDNGEE